MTSQCLYLESFPEGLKDLLAGLEDMLECLKDVPKVLEDKLALSRGVQPLYKH